MWLILEVILEVLISQWFRPDWGYVGKRRGAAPRSG
jgi:hypothetical protein